MNTRKLLRLWIPGTPQGKGRARSFIRNGKIAHITPEKTRTYEGNIKTLAIETMGELPPSSKPIRIDLVIVMRPSDSWPEWKKELAYSGRLSPTAKPDSDNVEKAVKDALNGIAWLDDAQVVQDTKQKIFGERPGVRVEVVELEAVPSGVKSKRDLGKYLENHNDPRARVCGADQGALL